MTLNKTVIWAFALLVPLGTELSAAQLPATERLLLPLAARNAPGAYGTTWTNELLLILRSNASDFVVPFILDPSCDPPDPCTQLVGYGAGSPISMRLFRTRPNQTAGSYLYVAADQLPDISMHLFLRETTRGNPSIELPIVRDREFSSAPRDFMDVQASPFSRVALRIYGDDPDRPGSVRVRIFSATDATLISDKTYPLKVTQLLYPAEGAEWKLRPPTAQIDALTDGVASPAVYVEVSPATPGLRLWALLSITDNVTQQVTLRYAN